MPLRSASKRALADSGTYSTLLKSPSAAVATARQISTSKPDQSPSGLRDGEAGQPVADAADQAVAGADIIEGAGVGRRVHEDRNGESQGSGPDDCG